LGGRDTAIELGETGLTIPYRAAQRNTEKDPPGQIHVLDVDVNMVVLPFPTAIDDSGGLFDLNLFLSIGASVVRMAHRIAAMLSYTAVAKQFDIGDRGRWHC
jgi:hypothetical protein